MLAPKDWNDHPAWETYHRTQLAADSSFDPFDTGSISIDELPQLAQDMKSRGWCDVWVPGCGLSTLARGLSHLGLNVLATDVSPVAIDFQLENEPDFVEALGKPDPAGTFRAEVHDLRTDFRATSFDLILNVRAFQGFRTPDLRAIAGTHVAALRNGRYAYFDTLNVQGENRDRLERTLEEAGFVVPFGDLNRWFRRTLAETGLPYVMVLGQPMIPRTGIYAEGGEDWERGMARLREINTEYNARLEAGQDAEQQRMGGDAKIAQIIYSTG